MWLRLKPPITTNIKSALILVAAGIILLRQLVPLMQLIRNFPLNDLSVYLDGTKATLRGENPYIQWYFDRYNYPPAATVLFVRGEFQESLKTTYMNQSVTALLARMNIFGITSHLIRYGLSAAGLMIVFPKLRSTKNPQAAFPWFSVFLIIATAVLVPSKSTAKSLPQ